MGGSNGKAGGDQMHDVQALELAGQRELKREITCLVSDTVTLIIGAVHGKASFCFE